MCLKRCNMGSAWTIHEFFFEGIITNTVYNIYIYFFFLLCIGNRDPKKADAFLKWHCQPSVSGIGSIRFTLHERRCHMTRHAPWSTSASACMFLLNPSSFLWLLMLLQNQARKRVHSRFGRCWSHAAGKDGWSHGSLFPGPVDQWWGELVSSLSALSAVESTTSGPTHGRGCEMLWANLGWAFCILLLSCCNWS